MAIVLEANYAKKLGLPGYSSHQYSVSIRAELTDLSQVQAESRRLYRLLQDAVDQEIQEVGFIPEPATYGTGARRPKGRPSAVSRGEPISSEERHSHFLQRGFAWKCSERQKSFIKQLVHDIQLDKSQVEQLSLNLFGAGVRQLNRLQASGLIDAMIRRYGRSPSATASAPNNQAKINGSAQHALPQVADRFRTGAMQEGGSALPL